MKIAITGHRPNKLGNDYNLTSLLVLSIKRKIIEIIMQYLRYTKSSADITFITGMALGIDQLFAMIAIEQDIKYIAAIPCLSHEYKWSLKSKQIYNELIHNPLCTKHIVTNMHYFPDCMQIRNKWMVDQLDLSEDILIAVWDGSSGGTKNCVDYAKSKGFIEGDNLIIINPKKL